jgi:hypothetical protein
LQKGPNGCPEKLVTICQTAPRKSKEERKPQIQAYLMNMILEFGSAAVFMVTS